jgi:Rad3-related DNA helicase
MQATGRIARSPTDYGETWIIDGSFDRLVNNALELDLVPKWFKEMLFPTTLNEEIKQ